MGELDTTSMADEEFRTRARADDIQSMNQALTAALGLDGLPVRRVTVVFEAGAYPVVNVWLVPGMPGVASVTGLLERIRELRRGGVNIAPPDPPPTCESPVALSLERRTERLESEVNVLRAEYERLSQVWKDSLGM